MKKRKALSKRQQKLLAKKIIEYFFSHPYANSTKEMVERFNVHNVFIRKTISKELERRLSNTDRIRKL